MATFDKDSRYVSHAVVYKVTDRRGREVEALTPAAMPPQRELGEHQRRQGPAARSSCRALSRPADRLLADRRA